MVRKMERMSLEQKLRLAPSKRAQSLGLSGIREIFEKAQKIHDVIRLEFGEPDFDTPDNIKAAAIRAIEKGYTKYSSSAGMPELRNAISSKLKRENGINYDPSNEIVVTAGATAALNAAFLATVDFGDEILVPDPGWATYVHGVKLVGAKPVLYPLKESLEYEIEREDLEGLITPNTKAILINTPSNPMGSILSRNNLDMVAELAIRYDLFVISDEVYEKFLYDDSGANEHVSIGSLKEMKDRTITINAFSKTYAMTGWRIGYAASNAPIAGAMTKIVAAAASCVSTIAQYAGLEALTGPQESVSRMIAAFDKRRRVLVSGLNRFKGFSTSMPKGAFYAFPNTSETRMGSRDLAMKIVDEAHVAVVPGSAFGEKGESHIRLAYANSVENIEEALSRMEKILPTA
jgi:aspartate/methionine/tyrosine aminotransferase